MTAACVRDGRTYRQTGEGRVRVLRASALEMDEWMEMTVGKKSTENLEVEEKEGATRKKGKEAGVIREIDLSGNFEKMEEPCRAMYARTVPFRELSCVWSVESDSDSLGGVL